MNRQQAIAVYKEIVGVYEGIGYNAYNLKQSDRDDPEAEDYQIQILMPNDPFTTQIIAEVAKKHDLEIRQEQTQVTVYKQKKIAVLH